MGVAGCATSGRTVRDRAVQLGDGGGELLVHQADEAGQSGRQVLPDGGKSGGWYTPPVSRSTS
ncbi:hypothetical protein GCM10014715_87230 [Streptomyces spiralis]|uniref:Uncharacterized protein n=1 Tax=Streptomyces spiralis TaxID=66376 RepID=A0A919APK0_9ACTN|nr:hypothetical protein GCM10014715_87230 [Streptomyces spiralis]